MSLLNIIGIIISHVLLAQSLYNKDNDSSVDCRKDCVELPGSETFPLHYKPGLLVISFS